MVNHRVERSHGESASEYDSFTLCQLEAQSLSNTTVLQSNVETISLKLTKEQARLLEKTAREEGFPSKSEFVRYALARALEDRLSVETIEEIFEARRQVRAGKTVPWARLKAEG